MTRFLVRQQSRGKILQLYVYFGGAGKTFPVTTHRMKNHSGIKKLLVLSSHDLFSGIQGYAVQNGSLGRW